MTSTEIPSAVTLFLEQRPGIVIINETEVGLQGHCRICHNQFNHELLTYAYRSNLGRGETQLCYTCRYFFKEHIPWQIQ